MDVSQMQALRLRIILILMVALAGLVGFYLLYDAGRGRAKSGKWHSLVTIAAEEVSRLVIAAPGRARIVMARSRGIWSLVGPIRDRADQKRVSDILSILSSIIGDLLFEETPPELDQYGLDLKSAILFSVTDQKGYTEELRLGRTVALDSGKIYLLDERSGKVYRVLALIKDVLAKDVSELRDRSALRFDREAVRRLTVKNDRAIVTVARADEGWVVGGSAATHAADGELVRMLLQRLSDLQVADFPDYESGKERKLPPGGPLLMVQLELQDGERQQLTVGREYREGLRYAVSSARGYLLGISGEIVELLPHTVTEFRERRVLCYDLPCITSIDLVRGAERVILKRRAEGWWLAYPQECKAADRIVDIALTALSEVRLVSFLDSFPAGVSSNNRPWVRLTLHEENGKRHFLEIQTMPQGPSCSYAFSSLHEQPFLISGDSLAKLPLSDFRLCDRRLLRFEAGSIEVLELRYPQCTLRLEKMRGEWVVTKPRRSLAYHPTVWQIITRLEAVTYEEEYREDVSRSEGPEGPKGPEEPERSLSEQNSDTVLEVVLWKEKGNEVGRLTFTATPDALLATSSMLPGVYQVAVRVLDGIPDCIGDLEYRR